MLKRAAGIVVVRKAADGWLVLLLRAYRNWDFPKGLIEAGEDPLSAAIRETREETSLDDVRFCWGLDYTETAPYAGGKIARYYLAETARADLVLPISEELGKPEHDEYRWLTFATAATLLAPRLQRVIDWAEKRIGAA